MGDDKVELQKLLVAYKTIYRLLILPESDWKTKIWANAAMAYFIHPRDILPEAEMKRSGYLDDLYISLLILNDISQYRPSLLKKASGVFNEDISKFIQDNLKQTERALGKKAEKARNLIGYEFLKSLDIANISIDDGVSKKLEKNSRILGIIAFLYMELKNSGVPLTTPHIVSLEESSRFFDVRRICRQYISGGHTKSKIDDLKDLKEVLFDYEDFLKGFKQGSRYRKITKLALPIFRTLCNILKDKSCDGLTKQEINSVLSYFALIEDVIEDSISSGLGLVDDVFLGSFILFDLAERNVDLVERNFSEGLDLGLIFDVFEKSSSIVEHDMGHIINLLGLKGLMTFSSLQQEKRGGTIDGIMTDRRLNHQLKLTLIDLARLYFGRGFFDTQNIGLDEVEKLIDGKIADAKRDTFRKFIEISQNMSYNLNIKKEIEKQLNQEMRLLLLKHKILSGENE